ncbi:MAG: InlB B-repeat-containing protein, partial [Erysipelotrichaceae bacterium]|nr:InlB B-repeat-containing protein [Erysipelotrichaceae bacterium]
YTDNISTGSGSWSGTATSLTHTFRNPESQLHYQFLYWENQSNGARYSNDQKVTFNSSNTPSGTLDVYAIWKPSVTVNYYDHEGKLFNSIESFEKIDVYDVTAAQIDGCEFLGWKADDAILEEDAAYVAPSAVSQRVSRYEIDVHAVYSTSYTVEHYLEDLDGEYVLEESTLVENVLLGSDISTEANEYTGFTFNEEIEGTMTEGKATANAVLRFYYTRNSYNVIYSYGEAPKGASELPAAASYKYGASVQIEKNASAPGYRFSGWDIDEDFEMPAEDVLISGSFTAKPKKVSEETTVTNVPDEPEVIITPEVRNTPTTPKTDDTVTVIEIKEEAVPSAKNTESEGPVIEVLDEEVPMANVNNSWALINLLAAVISTLVSLLMILSFFRKEEDEEEKNRENENEETKRSSSKFLGLLPTIVSWFAFFLTEDMRNPMVLIDRYTIIMLVIMIITMVMAYITRNRKDTKEEDLTVATELQ